MRTITLWLALCVLALAGCHRPGTEQTPASATAAGSVATLPPPLASDKRSEDWWQQRHHAIVDRARQGGWKVAFLGDSITQGWESNGKDVWAREIEPHKAINCGISGDRVQHVRARLEDGLLDALAAPNNDIRVVVLLIGTNNTTAVPPDSGADIARGIRSLVDQLHTRLPRAKVEIMNILPRDQFHNARREIIAAANTQIAGSSPRPDESVLDIGASFLLPTGELNKDLMPDYLHLSPAGYEVWASGLRPVLAGVEGGAK